MYELAASFQFHRRKELKEKKLHRSCSVGVPARKYVQTRLNKKPRHGYDVNSRVVGGARFLALDARCLIASIRQ